jgi:predicted Rossmann fold flavoprotein
MTKQYDVIVIGGGASGMMAAGVAASRGKKVLLLEKGKSLGAKVKISGGGRCNITNAEPDVAVFLSQYGISKDFLYSAFSQFGPKNTFSFFEKLKLPLVAQARQRVFPHTEKANDVVTALERYLKSGGVDCRLGCEVKRLRMEPDQIGIKDKKIAAVETNLGDFLAKSYILATGGLSHPETGSTGDGFNWLRGMRHLIKNPTPTIVPIKITEPWLKKMAGVSLPLMKIIFYVDGKKKLSKTGPLLFTHFGLSGPLILNTARQVNDWLQEGVITAKIDLFADEDFALLESRIVSLFDQNKNKELKTVLKDLLLPKIALLMQELLPEIDFTTKVHSITKEQRKQLTHLLKGLPVTITSLMGFDRAVVADGGVTLSEIDMRTMRSKLISNLYVTGDLLNITRPSGGFSLQLCWTTGYVAGMAVGK